MSFRTYVELITRLVINRDEKLLMLTVKFVLKKILCNLKEIRNLSKYVTVSKVTVSLEVAQCHK